MFAQILVALIFSYIFMANLWADKKPIRLTVRRLTKPLLVPLLMLFYVISAENINWLIVTALFFGFLGDVFLMINGDKRPEFFALGLLAFMIGHLVYITVFAQSISYFQMVPGWFYLCLIPYIAYGIFIFIQLKPHLQGIMVVGVILYMCVILMMSFTSLCRVWRPQGADLSFWFPLVGSLLFVASDSILALQKFIFSTKNFDAIIMWTYVSAQTFIVLGFLG